MSSVLFACGPLKDDLMAKARLPAMANGIDTASHASQHFEYSKIGPNAKCHCDPGT